MKTKSTAHVTLDLDDVIRAGGVEQALRDWCEESDDTSCGVVGPSFSTSGPGSGWSIQHNENDFAVRAFEEGALHYLDTDDGRLISAESAEDAEEDEGGKLPEGVHRDIGGCLYRVGDWSDESCVRIECPEVEEALGAPALVAEMAEAVIRHHHPESDCGEWRKLIQSIRDAAEALESVDLDDLPE